MKVNISSLKKDGLQLRECLSEDVVAEYAEAMRHGAVFPPVTVFREGGATYLADGFHRVEAAQRAGLSEIDADVRAGGYFDAEKYACGANSVTPRSSETKMRCVLRLWEHRRQHFGKDNPSDREIANLAKLPRSTVNDIVRRLANSGQLIMPEKVTGKDGVTRARPAPTRPSAPVRPAPTRDARESAQVRAESDENRCAFSDENGFCANPDMNSIGSKCCHCMGFTRLKEGYHVAEDGRVHAIGVLLDRFGVEVPEKIRGAFEGDALDGVIRQLQAARMLLRRAQDVKDIGVAAVSQRAGIEMENAYHELKAAKPYCVCRMCQGNGCGACRENGFQTEDQFGRNPPEMNP